MCADGTTVLVKPFYDIQCLVWRRAFLPFSHLLCVLRHRRKQELRESFLVADVGGLETV